MGTVGRAVAGRYRLVAQLGRGSMGTVWRAADELLGREVALKQLRLPDGLPESSRERLRARMRREARAAAGLKHPGIVTVYDQVTDEDDTPWIVMEIVRGRSLSEFVEERGPLPPARVARIGAQVASALAAAHAAHIIHRDVKPANVLLEGERVVLTDFGIAAIEGDTTTLTQAGAILGTPSYMAPEQLNEGAVAASDIWALGATLYFAVEGRAPFTAPNREALYHAISRGRPNPPVLAGALRGVLLDLLRKDPDRRPTADAARARLDSAIPADPPDGSRRGLTAPPPRADTSGPRALPEPTGPAGPPPAPGPRSPQRGNGPDGPQRALPEPTGPAGPAPAPGPRSPATSPQRGNGPDGPQRALPEPTGPAGPAPVPDPRGPATGPRRGNGPDGPQRGVREPAGLAGPAPVPGPRGPATGPRRGSGPDGPQHGGVETGPYGGAPASGRGGGADRAEAVPHGGAPMPAADARHGGGPGNGADGGATAPVGGTDTRGAEPGRETSAGERGPSRRLVVSAGVVAAVAAAVPTTLYFTWGRDGRRETHAGSPAPAVPAGTPDPARIALARALPGHNGGINTLAFHGATLISGSDDGTIRFWDTTALRQTGPTLTGHNGAVLSLAVSRDGKTLASGGKDTTIRLWSLPGGAALGSPLAGHTNWVLSLEYAPDGSVLASGGYDGMVRIWNPAPAPPLAGHTGGVWAVAYATPTVLFSGSESIRVWDPTAMKETGGPLRVHTNTVMSLAVSPDAKLLASGSRDQTVRLWDIATLTPSAPLTGHTNLVRGLAFHPGGGFLASGGYDGTMRLWNTATRAPIGVPLTIPKGGVDAIAFSPDGHVMASGGSDGLVRIWRL